MIWRETNFRLPNIFGKFKIKFRLVQIFAKEYFVLKILSKINIKNPAVTHVTAGRMILDWLLLFDVGFEGGEGAVGDDGDAAGRGGDEEGVAVVELLQAVAAMDCG